MLGVIDCNEWKTEKRHEYANMRKVKRLELWWQLYRTSLPVRDLFRPMDFCSTDTCTVSFLRHRRILHCRPSMPSTACAVILEAPAVNIHNDRIGNESLLRVRVPNSVMNCNRDDMLFSLRWDWYCFIIPDWPSVGETTRPDAVLPTNLFTDLSLSEIIGLFRDQTFVP